jgi:hypothetical protein
VKKLVLTTLVLSTLLFCGSLFAQTKASGDGRAQLYPQLVQVTTIFPSKDGYAVIYQSKFGKKTAFLPVSWFDRARTTEDNPDAGKAMLKLVGPGDYPCMVVYYQNKELDHVILYARKELWHPSWGSIPQGVDLSEEFKNATFKIE